MRLPALVLTALLVPAVALAAGKPYDPKDPAAPQEGAPWVKAPARLKMYGPDSHSEVAPRMTAADGAAKRAERAGWRTPQRSARLVKAAPYALTGSAHARNPLARDGQPGTFTARLLERGELDAGQVARADEMEDYLDDTQELTGFARTPGVQFRVLRKADIRESAIATRDTHTQLEVNGYAGGALELDLMMPSSGHHGMGTWARPGAPPISYQQYLIDFRHNARNDRLVLMVEHPDGTQEQIGPIPGNSYGHEGDLGRGAYVTTLRLKLDNLQVGGTKLMMVPEFTSVSGFANGRILELWHGATPPPPAPPTPGLQPGGATGAPLRL